MALFEGYAKDINRLISSRCPTGRIIFQDDFEATALKWVAGGTGTISRDTTGVNVFNGNASLKLLTGAIMPNNFLMAIRYVGVPPAKKLGVECYFQFTGTANDMFDVVLLRHLGGTIAQTYCVRYEIVNEYWSYATAFGTQIKIPGSNQRLQENFDTLFHHFKLIVDIHKREYVKLICNDMEVDMRGLGSNPVADVARDYFQLWFMAETDVDGTAAQLNVDDVIVTDES